MRINRCGLPLKGGEAYDGNKMFNYFSVHIILWTYNNDYHSNCLTYNFNIYTRQEQKPIKNRRICNLP